MKIKLKPLNRHGQMAFVRDMIVAGTFTFNQIVAAAREKYPDWSEPLCRQGLHNTKMRLRKKGSNANWLPEPAAPVEDANNMNGLYFDEKDEVLSPCCNESSHKRGSYKNVNGRVQVYSCTKCKKFFHSKPPLDGIRIKTEIAAFVVHLLCGGVGVRGVFRMTGLSLPTILRILKSAALRIKPLIYSGQTHIPTEQLEVFKMRGFVGCMQKNAESSSRGNHPAGIVFDAKTKLIVNVIFGKSISPHYAKADGDSIGFFNIRFTEATRHYSKKLENHRYAIWLQSAHFNFCRVHSSLKIDASETSPSVERTPAMAAGLADNVWTVKELITAD